ASQQSDLELGAVPDRQGCAAGDAGAEGHRARLPALPVLDPDWGERVRLLHQGCATCHVTGATLRPTRSFLLTLEPLGRMALRDTWHRTLVYFGLAEEEDP